MTEVASLGSADRGASSSCAGKLKTCPTLGRNLRITRLVIRLEPFKQRRRLRVQSELAGFGHKIFSFLRIVVETSLAHFFTPLLFLLLTLWSTVTIDPLHHLLVAFPFDHRGFEIVTHDPLPTEEHVIERTIKMILANVVAKQRATLVECPPQNDITAHHRVRTAWRFFGQIFSLHSCLHDKTESLPEGRARLNSRSTSARGGRLANQGHEPQERNHFHTQQPHRNAEGWSGRIQTIRQRGR